MSINDGSCCQDWMTQDEVSVMLWNNFNDIIIALGCAAMVILYLCNKLICIVKQGGDV